MLFDFLQPRAKVQEGLFIAKVEYDDYAISSFVICIGDSAISLLPGSVPNLKLDSALVDLQGAEAKINTNRCDIVL